MKRIPILPTLLVLVACVTMIGLGVWQLQRAKWKQGLIAQFHAAANQPAIAFPLVPDPRALPLYRKASGHCLAVNSWSAIGRHSAKGQSGWSHIAHCSTGAEGPGMVVDIGWSLSPGNPDWKGGEVSGVVGSDPKSLIRLTSDTPLAPGLEASAAPDIEDVPNNHLSYAVQWFLFAGIAAIIYSLALRRRMRA
jgi:surfeit locus 1 family protein